MTSEFQVGDKVLHEDFERCGAGTGVVTKLRANYNPIYQICVLIDHQRHGKTNWWFPLSKISHIQQPYDPLQNGDTEEDI